MEAVERTGKQNPPTENETWSKTMTVQSTINNKVEKTKTPSRLSKRPLRVGTASGGRSRARQSWNTPMRKMPHTLWNGLRLFMAAEGRKLFD